MFCWKHWALSFVASKSHYMNVIRQNKNILMNFWKINMVKSISFSQLKSILKMLTISIARVRIQIMMFPWLFWVSLYGLPDLRVQILNIWKMRNLSIWLVDSFSTWPMKSAFSAINGFDWVLISCVVCIIQIFRICTLKSSNPYARMLDIGTA
jgi:hypothetical protein